MIARRLAVHIRPTDADPSRLYCATIQVGSTVWPVTAYLDAFQRDAWLRNMAFADVVEATELPAPHLKDTDCARLDGAECLDCGVSGGAPCHVCGGVRSHADGCTEY